MNTAEPNRIQAAKPTGDVPMIIVMMSDIMASIGSIEKTRTNSQQGFKYRGIDEVMAAFQKTLIEHGVFFVPEVLSREERDVLIGTKTWSAVTLVIAYTFYCTADGSSIRTVVVGEAMDGGDKATNKAMSVALKYALLQIFCVPPYDDDADASSPRPDQRSAKNASDNDRRKPAPKPAPAAQSQATGNSQEMPQESTRPTAAPTGKAEPPKAPQGAAKYNWTEFYLTAGKLNVPKRDAVELVTRFMNGVYGEPGSEAAAVGVMNDLVALGEQLKRDAKSA